MLIENIFINFDILFTDNKKYVVLLESDNLNYLNFFFNRSFFKKYSISYYDYNLSISNKITQFVSDCSESKQGYLWDYNQESIYIITNFTTDSVNAELFLTEIQKYKIKKKIFILCHHYTYCNWLSKIKIKFKESKKNFYYKFSEIDLKPFLMLLISNFSLSIESDKNVFISKLYDNIKKLNITDFYHKIELLLIYNHGYKINTEDFISNFVKDQTECSVDLLCKYYYQFEIQKFIYFFNQYSSDDLMFIIRCMMNYSFSFIKHIIGKTQDMPIYHKVLFDNHSKPYFIWDVKDIMKVIRSLYRIEIIHKNSLFNSIQMKKVFLADMLNIVYLNSKKLL